MTTTIEAIVPQERRAAADMRFARLGGSAWTAAPMPGEAVIRINLLNATVSRGTAAIRLAGRDLELTYCIALRERPISRAELIAELWPALGHDADATNAFNLCLHRLRRRLGRHDAIVLTPFGYTLGPHASTDLRALEIFTKTLAGRSSMSDYEAELVHAARRRLEAASAPAQIAGTDAGQIFARRVDDLKHGFARQLATVSLRSNEVSEALAIAREMIRLDGCDESAWEIAIRAHIARNDRPAAVRDYRTYAKILHRELGLPPSRAIKRLMAQRPDDSPAHYAIHG